MAIGGKDFDISLGFLTVHVDTTTLTIEDATAVAKTHGIPNGKVSGEVGASGDMVLDIANFNLVNEAARSAGSFRDLPSFDVLFYARDNQGEEMRVEAFGCAFRLDSLLNIDSKGGEKSTVSLKYDVTSPEFIRINGVPYLTAKETLGIF